MRELRFEGLSDDGSRLVLVGKDGQRWSVLIDERVEAAVRRDRARLGQVEIEQSGELRPREIQARIRAGATAADVAAASGLPLERIKRFEGPVLTERAWIAQQAGLVPVRRQTGDITLAELVTNRLGDQGVAEDDIVWDAWRADEGPWTVIATFPLGPNTHVATWTYDQVTRSVAAVDDNAEDLTAAAPPGKLRLVAARPQLAAVEPVEAVTPVPAERSVPAGTIADDLQETAEPADDPDTLAAGADSPAPEPAPQAKPGPTPRTIHRGSKRPTRHPSGTQLPPKPIQAVVEPAPAEPAETPADEPAGEVLFEADAPANPKPKSGRSAVPSFDDILFGPAPKR